VPSGRSVGVVMTPVSLRNRHSPSRARTVAATLGVGSAGTYFLARASHFDPQRGAGKPIDHHGLTHIGQARDLGPAPMRRGQVVRHRPHQARRGRRMACRRDQRRLGLGRDIVELACDQGDHGQIGRGARDRGRLAEGDDVRRRLLGPVSHLIEIRIHVVRIVGIFSHGHHHPRFEKDGGAPRRRPRWRWPRRAATERQYAFGTAPLLACWRARQIVARREASCRAVAASPEQRMRPTVARSRKAMRSQRIESRMPVSSG
jgi:hypothetical protein